MKSAMLSLIAVTTTLGIVSAWDVAIYSKEVKNCGKSASDGTTFTYASYEGSGGRGPCIEAGVAPVGSMGPTNTSLDCKWFIDGGQDSIPCTGSMKPHGGSIMIGYQTQCEWYLNDAGKGITGLNQGGCVNSNHILDSQCVSEVPETDQQIYVQCRDANEVPRATETPGHNRR